ncbi:manganese/iron ABC transporter ATP-binding protein [Citrobacter sp. JGM124]|uniref:manganese/iron ABC transporter ATP-binding protein n=1 Tax=Citrobacter sp. JGM124 TaxID=2799789 RepID=UPI001BAB30CA|nr:manganese/iron ABC transporter ATP-binding protein [Citrobacter sp. JGM124]MBS0849875.1 manganese/iron ABC transporter ATP-binding protein [Citrobacter sp. JGM124]
MSRQPGIVVKGASVTYRNGHTALRNATFEIPTGTIAALVGVNGSGKSTLFKAIMGFVRLAGGSISILGQPTRQALRRNQVSYVPQSEDVDWTFPVLVEDVVMMGRFGHMGMLRIPSHTDKQSVDHALERVGMSDYRHRQIGELSGGQKKRVFLARSIAQDGQVILLDEPFTGVDVKTEEQIIQLLRELRDEGRTLLVSTHNLGAVTDYCDYTVLVKGTVLACGPTRETFTQENLELAFSGVLRHVALTGSETSVLTDDERPFIRSPQSVREK